MSPNSPKKRVSAHTKKTISCGEMCAGICPSRRIHAAYPGSDDWLNHSPPAGSPQPPPRRRYVVYATKARWAAKYITNFTFGTKKK